MDQKAIEADIKNYKVREGPLYKRSKFLKEWRERWVVLTTNYLYTFTSKNLDEVTDVVDLKDMKSYKSYLRKDQEMIPPGFKIRTGDDMYYFCAKNCGEKWSWIVSFERLMDYKYVGTSNYNNADWIKTRGFQSQLEFQGNKGSSSPEKPAEVKQAKKDANQSIENTLQQMEKQRQEFEKKKLQLDMRQASLQKRESDVIAQLKKIEQQRKILSQKQEFIMKEAQTKVVVDQPKKQEPKKQEPKKEAPPKEAPKQVVSPSKTESQNKINVSSIRSMYENKTQQNPTPAQRPVAKQQQKNAQKNNDINRFRAQVVNGLFEEYRKQVPYGNVLKYVTEFLVNIGSDDKCGYSSYVIIEGKSHQNRKNFAEVFIELLINFENYQKCENLMKFYEICIFMMPDLFNETQSIKGQNKLKQIFLKVQNEQILAAVLKNMLIMNKLRRYQKGDLQARLQKIIKETKNDNIKNLATKFKGDLDK